MQMKNQKAVVFNRLRIYLVFWSFLIIAFLTVIYIQVRKHGDIQANINSLNRQISEASAEQLNLQQAIALKASDKSVEDYAHNQLGLVYPFEIMIVNDNYKADK